MTTGWATGDDGLSQVHRQDADEPVAVRRGIDRRSLIKRAAAAGAVAWTAPVIFDSLASPAAAGTCGAIFRVTLQMRDDGNCTALDVLQSTAANYVGNGACNGTASVTPPGQYTETVTDLASSLTLAQTCISLGASANCAANSSAAVSATLVAACTPSSGVTGCSTPLNFLAAAISSNAPNTCEKVQRGGATTTHITGITGTQVDFVQPSSTHPGHSGSYQFVVGCSCTFP